MIISRRQYNNLWFVVIAVLLSVQYLRPQEFLGMPQASFFLPVALLTLLFVVFSGRVGELFALSQLRLMTLFFLWMVFLVPFSASPGAAVQGLRTFLPLLPFVFSIVLLVNDVKMLRKAVDAFILLTSAIAVIGLATHSGGRYQYFGLGNFLTDPNDYALFMNTMLPVCFFMFMYERKKIWKKIVYGLATILALATIIASFSRGGFLGMLCVAAVMWWFSPNKKLTAIVGVVVFIGVLFAASTQWKEVVSTSFDTQQNTAQTRLTTWKMSLKTFIDNPMGVGITNIPVVMHLYADSSDNAERWWGDVNHSFWLTALAEGGVIGFLLVLALLYHNVRDCLRMGRLKPINEDARFIKYFGYAYLGSLVGFCASGTFLTVNYYPHLWYITGFIAAGCKLTHYLSTRKT